VGPFVFLDDYGPDVFGPGQGANVRPHPHIGLSTLSYLMDGEMVHRDSAGHVQSIRPGDANWMTAGRGIVHSERAPASAQAAGGHRFGQQIWVALPKALEEMEPVFSHHGKSSLPNLDNEGVAITVVAGSGFGARSPVPSYSDLMYVDAVLQPRSRLQVPVEHVERAMILISGEVEVEGEANIFARSQFVVFRPGAEVVLRALGAARVILLAGEPFAEQRHVYWNFVSSSRERIEAAKEDWRSGRFPAIAGETEFIPLPPDPGPPAPSQGLHEKHPASGTSG
jgi:redox-sensitive bicupin YhaK (pirin superfamily)